MKNNLLLRLTGITFLLLSIAIASFSTTSSTTSDHPPGICTLIGGGNSPDLQPCGNLQSGIFSFGVLPDPLCVPEPVVICYLRTSAGKAMPKTARQRLYGIGNMQYHQKLC